MVRSSKGGTVLSARSTPPLQYIDLPYPDEVVNILSRLPAGFQALAYQNRAISLDFILFWGRNIGIVVQIRSNSSVANDLNFETPLDDAASTLWSMLGRLDPQVAPFERLMCLGDYLQLSSMYYRKILITSPVFQNMRLEATQLARTYQPRTQAERDALVYYVMFIINSWKTSNIVEPEGLDLLNNLKTRFAEYRHWDTLRAVLQNFPWIPSITAEWEETWLQSCR
jgi:hypothetical protein